MVSESRRYCELHPKNKQPAFETGRADFGTCSGSCRTNFRLASTKEAEAETRTDRTYLRSERLKQRSYLRNSPERNAPVDNMTKMPTLPPSNKKKHDISLEDML